MELRLLKLSMLCATMVPILGESQTLLYHIVPNKRFLNTFMTETADTELSCCRLCASTLECEIANYKSTDMTCELGQFDVGDESLMVLATGWSVIYETGDDCASNPCMNSGVCTDGIGHYTCDCGTRYAGTNCEIGCGETWEGFGNSCYYLQRRENNWDDAVHSCDILAASLVAINSEEENDFIEDLLVSNGIQGGLVWIGGRNLSIGYQWTHGEAIEDGYVNWDSGEPSSPSIQNCLVIGSSSPYRWHDALCSAMCASVCECGIVWIGGRNISGRYQWTDGEGIEGGYVNWGYNQPDHPSIEDCLGVLPHHACTWFDLPCEIPSIAICEFETDEPMTP